MTEIDSGFMEVLAGNLHYKSANFSVSSYLLDKYFDSYCAMVTFFSSFTPDKWGTIFPTQTLSLADLEKYSWATESGIATIRPYFEFVWTYYGDFYFGYGGVQYLPKQWLKNPYIPEEVS